MQIRIITANVCYIGIQFHIQNKLPQPKLFDPKPNLMQDSMDILLGFTKKTC